MSSSPFQHVQECNSLMSAEITRIMGVQPFWFRSPLTDGNTAQPLPVLVLSQTSGAAVVTGLDAYALLAKLSSVLTEGRMSDDKITMWVNLMNYETAYDAGGHAVINTHITAVLEKAKG